MQSNDLILKVETRRVIYNFVKDNPGFYIRNISRKLSIPYSTLKYHLDYLEKNNLISSKRYNGNLRYYIKEKIGMKYRDIINILRQDTTRKIIICLLDNTCCTREELSNELKISPQTISFHLNNLLELGMIREPKICEEGVDLQRDGLILDRKPKGSEKLYILTKPGDIFISFINYRESLENFPDIDILIEYFTFCFSTVVTKRFPQKKTIIDRFVDEWFELFPFPWTA